MTINGKSIGPAAAKPALKPPQTIKQDEMREVLNQRLVIDTLKRDLKKADEELLKMELVLIDRVQRSARQESGTYSLGVDVENGRKQTPWKELYAKLAGPEHVEIEMDATRKVNAQPENQKAKLVVMSDGQIEKTA